VRIKGKPSIEPLRAAVRVGPLTGQAVADRLTFVRRTTDVPAEAPGRRSCPQPEDALGTPAGAVLS
jgi:hypothetical protein